MAVQHGIWNIGVKRHEIRLDSEALLEELISRDRLEQVLKKSLQRAAEALKSNVHSNAGSL